MHKKTSLDNIVTNVVIIDYDQSSLNFNLSSSMIYQYNYNTIAMVAAYRLQFILTICLNYTTWNKFGIERINAFGIIVINLTVAISNL